MPSRPVPGTDSKLPLWAAYALGILAVIIFGSTLPVTRIALLELSPGFITFCRAVVAAALAFCVLWYFRVRLFHTANLRIFLAGIFLIHGFPGLMAIGLQTVPASHGGVILGILPLATAVGARLIGGETPSIRFWILTAAGLIIVASYVIFASKPVGNPGVASGDLWLLTAGICAAAGYVIFGVVSRTTPGWEVICRALILNLPITLIGIWFFYDPALWSISAGGLGALLYLGTCSMFLGFCAWNVALAHGGIARIGQLQLLQIFITLAIAWVLLSEPVSVSTFLAAALITLVIASSRSG